MIGDCESERIWKLIESSRSQVAVAKKKSASLTLLEHVNNACADCSDKLQDKRFTTPVNVLDRLSGNMATPAMIVNLLPGHEGYSVALGNSVTYGNTGANSYTHHDDQMVLPYEDTELIEYLDAGQIPPVLLPLIDNTKCCQLVDGSLIVELRNYRGYQELPGKFSQRLLLLKPTSENIVAAVNHAVDVHKGTEEDGLLLESKLLLATQPPLCLDTTTDVACVANRLQYNKHKYHTPVIRRYLKRNSQTVLTRAQMNQDGPSPKFLRLYEYMPHEVHNEVAPVSHDLGVGSLEVPASPHLILQEVNSRLPAAMATPESNLEASTTDVFTVTTSSPLTLLMKSYDEKADQYLVKPQMSAKIDPAHRTSFLTMLPKMQEPTVAMDISSKPQILSPIEKPVMYVTQPIVGQRSSIQVATPTISQPIQISSMHMTAVSSMMHSISGNIQPATIPPVMQATSGQKTMQPLSTVQLASSQISSVQPTIAHPTMQSIQDQYTATVPPPMRGQRTRAIPPVISGQRPTAIPPTISGQRTTAIPPGISVQRTTAIPPGISGQRPIAIPPGISGQRPTAIPPTISGQRPTAIPPGISGQRTIAIPPGISGQRTTAIPPGISGQRTIAIPPTISGQRPTAIPPTISGQRTTAVPPAISGQRTMAIPPVMSQQRSTPPVMKPIDSQKSSVGQLSVTPLRMRVSTSMTRSSLSMPRPISSITSVMSTKPTEGAMPTGHFVTPIPAKLLPTPQRPKLTELPKKLPLSSSSSIPSAVPIMSSNISIQIVSVGASAAATSSIATAKTTSQGQRYPLLIRHRGNPPPRVSPPNIQKPTLPLHSRSSSPVPPPRPPPLRPAPRPPTLQSQKAPPLAGLPRMPMLHRGAPRPATPPTSTK